MTKITGWTNENLCSSQTVYKIASLEGSTHSCTEIRDSKQEDFHSNRIRAERISVAKPPRLFDRYLLLKVPINQSKQPLA